MSDSYRPGLGADSCFLSEKWPAKFLYMNVVVLPLAVSNVAFFLSSTWSLCCGFWAAGKQGIRMDVGASASSSSRRTRHKAK